MTSRTDEDRIRELVDRVSAIETEKKAVAEKPNCRTCGACCRASSYMDLIPLRPFADLTDTEAQEIEEKRPGSVTLTTPSGWTFDPQRFAMAIKPGDHGRCVALRGTVGKKVSCGIYEDRPATCREFEPGSEQCLEARRKALGG